MPLLALLLILLLSVPLQAAELFTNPALPTAGEEVLIYFRGDISQKTDVNLQIIDAENRSVFISDLKLSIDADTTTASVAWIPPKNGVFRLSISSSEISELTLDLPVISPERSLDFAWYSYKPWMRWATVIASSHDGNRQMLQARGIKALQWRGVYPILTESLEETRQRSVTYHRVSEDLLFDGYGIDEFGGYPQTDRERHNHAWVRGIIDARAQFPEEFYIAGWHSGGVRDEAVGLYKQALDLLLLETYLMHWVPNELGTENIYEDLENRLIAIRGADLFTRTYKARARTLLALDVTGQKNTALPDRGEFEQVIRAMRRICPEMRGIAFFNGSATDESIERLAHDLCFEYFIKPVVTLQKNSLWIRQTRNRTELVAAVSNIGAIDSGPVAIRFLVDGEEIGTRNVDRVPAGYSRLTNRVLVAIDWTPPAVGTYSLQAEIAAAPGNTVLDPVATERRFLSLPPKRGR
jgi:hypothetical protein